MLSQWQPVNTRPHFAISDQRYVRLEHLAVLQISGADAGQFLQNLLTNDVLGLAAGQSQLTGFCNPKGRLLASFILYRAAQDYQIILPADQAAFIKQRLSMFVLRSKVSIEDLSDALAVLGLSTKAIDLSLPSVPLPWSHQQLLILLPAETLTGLEQQLTAQGWHPLPVEHWQQAELMAGVALLPAAGREQFTPQQLNFDCVGGVSFKKGCYPGQEVVARLHYLGKPSRRMFLGQCQRALSLETTQEIHDADGEVLGHLVSSVTVDDSTWMLISFKLSAVQKTAYLAAECAVDQIQALVAEDDQG